MEKSWNFIRMEKCMTPENNCASFFVVTASNHNYVNHYTIGLLHCTDRRHFIHGSHRHWKTWKTWKMTNKNSRYGIIMEFEKMENIMEKSWNLKKK